MNQNHVETMNKLAKMTLAKPPEAVLIEDSEGDYINFGGILIAHTVYENPSIRGPIKSLGYAVGVEVMDYGSQWEPPSVDYHEFGVYPCFVEAAARACSLWIDEVVKGWSESEAIDEVAYENERHSRDAFKAGHLAQKAGVPLDADLLVGNPYPEGTDLHKIWVRGWQEGDSEAALANYEKQTRIDQAAKILEDTGEFDYFGFMICPAPGHGYQIDGQIDGEFVFDTIAEAMKHIDNLKK